MGKLNRLTVLKVQRIAVPGRYGDGGGLYLEANAGAGGSLSKSWVFRYQTGKLERWMGLGSIDAVSLAAARQVAAEARALRGRGVDPLEHRKASKAAAAAAMVKTKTFDQCAAEYIEAEEKRWRNPRHAQQWRATIARYVSPVFGKLPVGEIDRGLVLQALEPIWQQRSETAARLRGRIELILDRAEAWHLRREGSNPARLLPITTALGRRSKKVNHFAALPYGDLPGFMTELRKRGGVAARALELMILTASRTGEVLGATWSEIDLTARTWTVPAARMKGGKDHRVPLTNAAIELLKGLPRELGNDFVFIGSRDKGTRSGAGDPKKKPRRLGQGAMLLALRSIRGDVTAHGMRSAFKDWASELTNFPTEAVEIALAHAVGSKVEEAYRRGDLFEKRRRLMDAWADYCDRAPSAAVVPLHSKVARGAIEG